jgi:hypothetical protein
MTTHDDFKRGRKECRPSKIPRHFSPPATAHSILTAHHTLMFGEMPLIFFASERRDETDHRTYLS